MKEPDPGAEAAKAEPTKAEPTKAEPTKAEPRPAMDQTMRSADVLPEQPLKPLKARDPVWDPPTIVYMPKEAAIREGAAKAPAGANEAAPRPVYVGPSGVETSRSAQLEDATIQMPDRKPAGEIEDVTVKLPDRRARGGDDDTTRKAQPRPPRVAFETQDDEDEAPQGFKQTVRWFLKRHGKKLWYLHTAYALGLGAFVVTFAQKGFDHARWLAVTVGVAWLVLLLFFRVFGTGARQDFATAWRDGRMRFLVMTYVLKNLYQGMLFFLLPFYWKSASLDAPNRWFVFLLGGCAVLSTLDLVFDRVLMRWKLLASVFHGVTLFACLNLIIPALFPNTRTLWTLLCAAGISVLGFALLHVPLSALWYYKTAALALLASVGAGVGLAYATRVIIPPVPMHLSSAAVGPQMLPDGRLAMEVKALHTSVIRQLIAVTDVVVPGGKGDRLHHVWRHEGEEIYRAPEEMSRVEGPEGSVRLKSQLGGKRIPDKLTGHWTVDVETEDGQLVGRTSFEVTR